VWTQGTFARLSNLHTTLSLCNTLRKFPSFPLPRTCKNRKKNHLALHCPGTTSNQLILSMINLVLGAHGHRAMAFYMWVLIALRHV
jgi:hypothetical protein